MTLIPYRPDEFDQLSLRLVDLAAIMRQIAQRSRSEGVDQVSVHAKKAHEWLGKLEFWAEETRGRFELAAMKNAGARKAKELLAAKPARKRSNSAK